MVGRALTEVYPKRPVAPGAVALELRHLSNRALGIHDVSLSVRRGEVLGVAGLVGSGRTELAETLFGLVPSDGGEILLRGTPVRIDSPAQAIRLGSATCRRIDASTAWCWRCRSRRTRAWRASARVVARPDRSRRRAAIGGRPCPALAHQDAVGDRRGREPLRREPAEGRAGALAVDRAGRADPRRADAGVDVGAKAEIHALIQELAERGLAIIMISSELPEVLGMSDRVAVMHAGTLSGVLSRAEATQDRILALALAQNRGAGLSGPRSAA
jgi:energy-coupling factor transporter ATP-binding protein EcfA2